MSIAAPVIARSCTPFLLAFALLGMQMCLLTHRVHEDGFLTPCRELSNFRKVTTYLADKRPIGLTRAQCISAMGSPNLRRPVRYLKKGSIEVAKDQEEWLYIDRDHSQIALTFDKTKCFTLWYGVSATCMGRHKHTEAFYNGMQTIRRDLVRQHHCLNKDLFFQR